MNVGKDLQHVVGVHMQTLKLVIEDAPDATRQRVVK